MLNRLSSNITNTASNSPSKVNMIDIEDFIAREAIYYACYQLEIEGVDCLEVG